MTLEELQLNVSELGKHLLSELLILRKFCKLDLSKRAREVIVVPASACTTGNAVFLMSEKPEYFYAETVMLARSFIEKMTNFCYLQVCDDEEYNKFLLHPYYRAFHNADKTKHAGEVKIQLKFAGKSDLKAMPVVSEALSIFSETNPRLNWSTFSLDEKVALLSARSSISPEFFLMNTLTIYSDASEALHGSLYGCALPTGKYIPGGSFGDVDAQRENILKNIALLYVQLGSLIHEMLKIFPENESVKELLIESNENHKNATALMKKIFGA